MAFILTEIDVSANLLLVSFHLCTVTQFTSYVPLRKEQPSYHVPIAVRCNEYSYVILTYCMHRYKDACTLELHGYASHKAIDSTELDAHNFMLQAQWKHFSYSIVPLTKKKKGGSRGR